MKLLFLGGTGLISSACVELAVERGDEVFLVNRGTSTRHSAPKGSTVLQADVRADPRGLAELIGRQHFDAVIDFLAYTPDDIRRSISALRDATGQFVFISSASAYQKPPRH